MVPYDEYVASLARKRMGAAALFRDQAAQVLLVDPVYRDTWGLPGGAVEADESPQAACRREVAEELGLDRPTGRILAVHPSLPWAPGPWLRWRTAAPPADRSGAIVIIRAG